MEMSLTNFLGLLRGDGFNFLPDLLCYYIVGIWPLCEADQTWDPGEARGQRA